MIFLQFTLKQITEDLPGFPLPWWLGRRDCTKFIIDSFRKTGEKDQTLARLAEQAGFNLDDITNWRSGQHRPTPFNMQVLAKTLAMDVPESDPNVVELLLRVATGVDYLRQKIERVFGRKRIEDLLEGFLLVAKGVFMTLSTSQNNAIDARLVALKVAQKGPFCIEGARVCREVSKLSVGSPFVAADLAALPGDWTARLQYWAKMLAEDPEERLTEQLQLLRSLGLGKSAMKAFRYIADELPLRTRDFIEPEAVVLRRVFIESGINPGALVGLDLQEAEEIFRPYYLSNQAEERFSVGDVAGGLSLVREAIAANPEDAGLHFSLGGRLGQVALHNEFDGVG